MLYRVPARKIHPPLLAVMLEDSKKLLTDTMFSFGRPLGEDAVPGCKMVCPDVQSLPLRLGVRDGFWSILNSLGLWSGLQMCSMTPATTGQH